MLTKELLLANAALAGLTEEQIAAITTLSQNDENQVIGTKIGELHGRYDADVLGLTGIAKNGAEKSYDYVKRVLGVLKDQPVALQAKITELTKQIQEGKGNEALNQQIKDLTTQVTQMQAELTKKDEAASKAKEDFDKQIKDTHVNYALESALSKLKFKANVSEPVQKILINAAKEEVLKKGAPDFIEKDGLKTLVFRDANGTILSNAKNNLSPFTAEELFKESVALKDSLDFGKKQPGGGTGGNGGNGGNGGKGGLMDLSHAKTQVEAMDFIESELLKSGLTRDSHEFQDKINTIFTENNLYSLPIQ